MKTKSTNSTDSYDPVAISENVSVEFRRTKAGGNVTVYGQFKAGGTNAGDLSYDRSSNHLTVRFKPRDLFTKAEVAAILQQAPAWLSELLDEEETETQA